MSMRQHNSSLSTQFGGRLSKPAWVVCLAITALVIGGARPAFATDVRAGDDLWTTPGGASYDATPIPAGFFTASGSTETSDAYTGGIKLKGNPLATNLPISSSWNADTIVRRLADAALPTCPSSATIEIEIVALSLKSVAPIVVDYPSAPSELWDVEVCLAPSQPQGSMTINHDCPNGGTYDAQLPVLPQFTFTRIQPNDGTQETFIPPNPVLFSSTSYWSHTDPTGGSLTTIDPTVSVDTDCDGTPDTVGFSSTFPPDGFFPGLNSYDCTCNTPGGGTFNKELTPEQARWAAHGVFVANVDKPQVVGACCDELGCHMTSQFSCFGSYKGDGVQCTPDPCLGGPPCGDGICDVAQGETSCTCPPDCGAAIEGCSDGIDNDCDGLTDCDDPDCANEPACLAATCCLPYGSCESMPTADCEEARGKSLGADSACQGDNDGDGIDDACLTGKCGECGPGAHWIDTPPCPAPDPTAPGVCKSNGVSCFDDSECPAECEFSGATCADDTECDQALAERCILARCNKISQDQDTFPTGALLGIDTDGDCVANTSFVLTGPATIHKLGPHDDSIRYPGLRSVDLHKDVIDTEIIQMTLTGGGATMLGGAGLGTIPLPPSFGAVAEDLADPFVVDSFFDVVIELSGIGLGAPVYNQTPIRVGEEDMPCLPANGRYIHFSGCTPLYDSPIATAGQIPIAHLVSAVHFTYPDCCLPNGTCEAMTKAQCESANGTAADCIGDSDGDGFDDACVPPVERCPEPAGQDWCADTSGCIPNASNLQFCEPTSVAWDSVNESVTVESCACFSEGPDCGPVKIREVLQADGTLQTYFECPGVCPDGATLCNIHIDGNDHGTSIIPVEKAQGLAVTCDCPGGGPEPDPHKTIDPTNLNFGTTDAPVIPADFFGPGSDPFPWVSGTGRVDLQGGGGGSADTLVQRMRRVDPDSLALGDSRVLQAEIIALNLVSIQPMTVTWSMGTTQRAICELDVDPVHCVDKWCQVNSPQCDKWTLEVDLSDKTGQPLGQMTVTKTHANGGTYDAQLLVIPKLTFTKVSGLGVPVGSVSTLEYANEGWDPVEINFDLVPWVQNLPAELQGTIEAPNDGDFVPGIEHEDIGAPRVVDATGTSKGGGVVHTVGPITFCPLPGDPATDLCAALQQSDCEGSPTDLCLPRVVQVGATGGAEALECSCFEPDSSVCGPIEIGTDSDGLPMVSCPGDCIAPEIPPCQIWADFNDGLGPQATGKTSAPMSQFAAGVLLYCDCAAPCTNDEDCDDGNKCTLDECQADGTCVHTTIPGCCADDSECPGCQNCENNVCVDNQAKCIGCEDCVNGTCVDNQAKCIGCEDCVNGTCVDNQAKCIGCEDCVNGTCVDNQAKCPGCQDCQGGICVDEQAKCIECELCVNASCVPDPACLDEPCCHPDGKCTVVPVGTCDGKVVAACLGDGDNNGIDDACQNEKCDNCIPGLHWIDTCPPADLTVPGICKITGAPCFSDSECVGTCSVTNVLCLNDFECSGGGDVCIGRTCNRLTWDSDTIPTGALLGIDLNFDCIADTSVRMHGVTTIAKHGPLDDSGHFPGTRPLDLHKDVVDTEIVWAVMYGGGVTLEIGTALGLNPSLGTVAELTADPSLAESRFDVMARIQGGGLGGPAYNWTPITVLETVQCLPPNGRYIHFGGCTPLYPTPKPDPTVAPIANLVMAIHFTFPDCCIPEGTGGKHCACVPMTAAECEDVGGFPANCLGDSDGDNCDDACNPPIDACPDPSPEEWCALSQGTDECIPDASDLQFCLPTGVIWDPIVGPQAIGCDCFTEGPNCGPVTITPIWGTTDHELSCKGICDGTSAAALCQIHLDGVASGLTSMPASATGGQVVTCECPPQECKEKADGSGCEQVDCPETGCFGECIGGSYCDDPNCCIQKDACMCYAPHTKESIKYCGDCFGECINGAYCDSGADPDCCIVPGACACYLPNTLISIQLCPDNACFGTCEAAGYCDPVDKPECALVSGAPACWGFGTPEADKLCGRNEPTIPAECRPKCVNFNPTTGVSYITACDCTGESECHAVVKGSAASGTVAGVGIPTDPCVVADNGSGTITLPPDGCEYLSPDEVHEIIDGLPAGVTVELAAIHKDFICERQAGGDPGACSVPLPEGLCETEDGTGSLGGNVDCTTSTLELVVTIVEAPTGGSTSQAGLPPHLVSFDVFFEVHTGLRNAGDAVQNFDTEMVQLQGALPAPDAMFTSLSIVAGSANGLPPSPGHTTLTRLPGGNFAVDSFFDVSYQIDFEGAPGGALAGLSGSTTGTIRMQTGNMPSCEGLCGPAEACARTETVNPNGTIDICCDCCPIPSAPLPNPAMSDAGFGGSPRFISFLVGDAGQSQAVRVRFPASMPTPYGAWSVLDMWLAKPARYCENSGNRAAPNPADPPNYGCDPAPGLQRWYMGATLTCDPTCQDWHGYCDVATTQCVAPSARWGDPCVLDTQCDTGAGGNGVCSALCVGGMNDELPCTDDADCKGPVYVFHEGIIPSTGPHNVSPITPTTYRVQAVDCTCDLADDSIYSDPLDLTTSKWGDTVLDTASSPYPPPEGIVQITDVLAILYKFQNLGTASISARVDLIGALDPKYNVDHQIDISDVLQALFAFQAVMYPPPAITGAPSDRPCE